MKKLALSSAIAMALSGQAMAAGFQLIEQSVSGMGTAYAGSAALAEDASTVYFNPAGMTKLTGSELVAAAHIVVPQADYTDGGSSITAVVGGGSLGTDTGGDSGVLGAVPNIYLTHSYNDRLAVGLGINAPFGLSTKYHDNWIGRYHAVESALKTININPSIAYKINDRLSLGAGLNVQYIDAKISNAIDFGTITLAIAGPGAGSPTPGQLDGFVTLKGDDWSLGYNLGLLFELSPQTRLGLHYRSEIDHKLTGTADFTVPTTNAITNAVVGGSGRFVDTGVSAKADLPATLSLSLYHAFNPQWAVMADISRTFWHSLPELRFDFANPLEPDGVTTLNWNNSNRYSIGATYKHTNRITYRFGLALDETPIPSPEFRTPRIPGQDRTWLAFGASYKKSDRLSFEFGYAHLFVKDPTINKTNTGVGTEDFARGNLIGSYDASVDILSAQLNYKF